MGLAGLFVVLFSFLHIKENLVVNTGLKLPKIPHFSLSIEDAVETIPTASYTFKNNFY